MSRRSSTLILICAALLSATGALAEDFQGSTHKMPYDDPPIRYSNAPGDTAVTRLQKKIDAEEARLKFDPEQGYLPALLKALDIPASSQLLVFSKTSLQRNHISPAKPRAIFFNDDVYVGYIPGAPMIEVSAVDPKLGGMFYSIEQIAAFKPQLTRNADCLQCHGGNRSLGVPGHILRSVGTDESGEIDAQTEVSEISHCTPLADRWAGWFVTGRHGSQTHRGNLIGPVAFARAATEPNCFGNQMAVPSIAKPAAYPRTGSDIVSHLVLDHQSHMHNYIARLNFETQIMMSTYGHIRYLDRQIDAFLRYLLFTEEAPLAATINGNPEFIQDFQRHALRDAHGRSLRDLDLQTRLFKYPCSFLIYSDAFDSLPEVMRDQVYARLWAILNGNDPSPDFAKMRAEDRMAVREILCATKKGLPAYWNESGSGAKREETKENREETRKSELGTRKAGSFRVSSSEFI